MWRQCIVVVRADGCCGEGRSGLCFGVGIGGFEIPAVSNRLGFWLVQRLLRHSGAKFEMREGGCDFCSSISTMIWII